MVGQIVASKSPRSRILLRKWTSHPRCWYLELLEVEMEVVKVEEMVEEMEVVKAAANMWSKSIVTLCHPSSQTETIHSMNRTRTTHKYGIDIPCNRNFEAYAVLLRRTALKELVPRCEMCVSAFRSNPTLTRSARLVCSGFHSRQPHERPAHPASRRRLRRAANQRYVPWDHRSHAGTSGQV